MAAYASRSEQQGVTMKFWQSLAFVELEQAIELAQFCEDFRPTTASIARKKYPLSISTGIKI